MFLPIGDIPNPRTTPYVNWALIGINVAIFLFISWPATQLVADFSNPNFLEYLNLFGAPDGDPRRISAYDLVVFEHGYRPAHPSLLSMFTAMFLHGGWMHLAGNMLFLWIYGDNVEHRLGHAGYLLAYLATGLAATIFFGLFAPDSQIPMLGASGAISGVLGLYFLWFPRNQVKVLIFLFPLLMTTVLIPARIVLGVYLVLDNIVPFLTTPLQGSGVAYGAHIGGFLAGLSLAYAVDRLPGLLHLRANAPRVSKHRTDLVSAITDIVQSVDHGELAHAAHRYLQLESGRQRGQLATSKVIAIGNHLLESGQPDLALTVFRRLIAERPGDVGLDRAYLGAGKAMMHKARGATSAYHYFLAAIDLAQSQELTREAQYYLHMIEQKG
ncbi:MAG: hypothetical protein C0614_13790 [Desulfuromonas sp.]|nr:MAG: hypothetical protein C0614_13790 [Desulfuromonas sp.]